jgi:acyl-CoA oxidase
MAICHAIICGTKANFTYFVANCAEWCRLSCGGHGYAHYSGLPAIYQDNCPNITLEGENQIMYL